ncbi:KfrB domain-containing protein [Yersinia massiliensis]|uniref:Conjugal transfer protein TraO n=1 Tax=Yersinia massiliensis TaxID=419257 RepID=A0ABM6V0E4_9GAMM|nr:KfrB domain-containing protein [Yersinia massiliensis]AVX40753.1 conjugal transfer protein TraO [Yersinia massiliensis]
MKQRLLVMNGQRIVQTEKTAGDWQNDKVDKAGDLKPGMYNIYLANQADKSKSYTGTIVHKDKENVYQQIGKNFVKHNSSNFDKVPVIGSEKTITYSNEQGRAEVSVAQKIGRSISR